MKTLLFLAVAFLAAASCQKASNVVADTPQLIDSGGVTIPPCDSDVICTMDFRMATVRILRPDSSAVMLDSFHVTDAAGTPLPPVNGEAVYGPLPDNLLLPPQGRYAVLTDLWVAGHRQTQATIYAKGWKGGILLFNELYYVGADCCHIYKNQGPEIIVVP